MNLNLRRGKEGEGEGGEEKVEEERIRWRRRWEGGGGEEKVEEERRMWRRREGGGNGEGRRAIWYKFTFPTPLLKTLQMSDIYQSVSLRFLHSCCQYRCYLCYAPHQTQQQNFAPFLCWQLLQSADTDTRINLFSRQRRSQEGGVWCLRPPPISVKSMVSWVRPCFCSFLWSI